MGLSKRVKAAAGARYAILLPVLSLCLALVRRPSILKPRSKINKLDSVQLGIGAGEKVRTTHIVGSKSLMSSRERGQAAASSAIDQRCKAVRLII